MRVSAAPAFRSRRSNPYQALLYDGLTALGVDVIELDPSTVVRDHPDIVHLHWPESALNKARRRAAAYRSLELLLALRRARRKGARVVWTVHNLRSHFGRYPRAERLFWKAFLPMVDGWVSLSQAGADAASKAHPGLRSLPHAVIPHGHYRDAYPDASRSEGRHALGLGEDERLVLFIGRVKPYKGVPALVRAFREVERPGLRLLVAGRCDEAGLAEELRAARADDTRVELRLDEVPEDEVAALLRAADLVVLPFHDILNSGSALLALSFEAPVLVPRLGAMAELAELVPGWVHTYDGTLAPDTLVQALDRRPPGPPDLSALSWAGIAAEHLNLFERVHASRR